MKCPCQDSSGDVCNKEMTRVEENTDGMCDVCACHVVKEMKSEDILFGDSEYIWHHAIKGESLAKTKMREILSNLGGSV